MQKNCEYCTKFLYNLHSFIPIINILVWYTAAASSKSSLVVSDSVQLHRRQPNWLHHPWGSPSKNTGVGCHFLLQCRKVTSESEVAQSCLTLHNPMDCSLPGSSLHGIFQARVLEWGAIAFSEYGILVRCNKLVIMPYFNKTLC